MNWYNGSEPQDGGDYPDMTSDDVAAMVCGKVASASASVDTPVRLEDLSAAWQSNAIRLVKDRSYITTIITDDDVSMMQAGLIEIVPCNSSDAIFVVTSKLDALVADYQQRQAERQPAGAFDHEGYTQNLYLKVENHRLQAELNVSSTNELRLARENKALEAEVKRLQDELLSLKVENRRVWDGFSVYYQVTGFDTDKRKVYLLGTVGGRSLLANDDDGTYTALWQLSKEYTGKKIEYGWVDNESK